MPKRVRILDASSYVAVSLLLTGCITQTRASPSSTTKEFPTHAKQVESDPLQAERDHILAMRAPRYRGPPASSEIGQKFIMVEVKEWIDRRRPATMELCERYRATASTVSAQEATLRFRNVAQIHGDFVREFIAAGTSAMPASIGADPEQRAAYLGTLMDTVQFLLDEAHEAADACIERTVRGSLVRRECEKAKQDLSVIVRTALAQIPPRRT